MHDFIQQFGVPWNMQGVLNSYIYDNGDVDMSDGLAIQMGFTSAQDLANATGLNLI
jgi:hypothetical protein